MAKLKSSGANNGALLMIDAHTGAIKAMVGSADFTNNSIAGQYNIVTASRRPGSSFKPYVYEAGFKSGTLKPDTILQDTRAQSQKYGGVTDFDNRFLGPITAARALVLSRNVATEQAADKAGIQNVIDLAYGMGISQKLTPQAPNLSTAIGTSAVRMIDHASAYAAFANGGHKVVANGILKITDGSGNILRDYTVTPNLGDVLTPAQAWSITSILRGYAKQWNLHFKYDTAGKSGHHRQLHRRLVHDLHAGLGRGHVGRATPAAPTRRAGDEPGVRHRHRCGDRGPLRQLAAQAERLQAGVGRAQRLLPERQRHRQRHRVPDAVAEPEPQRDPSPHTPTATPTPAFTVPPSPPTPAPTPTILPSRRVHRRRPLPRRRSAQKRDAPSRSGAAAPSGPAGQ